jgi:hypothetical protein
MLKAFSMHSLWLENQTLSLRDAPRPNNPGEALIRVRLAGQICDMNKTLVSAKSDGLLAG